MQVYAYGNSALHAALLRLFVRCEAVLPGLFVGTLTRESVIGGPSELLQTPVEPQADLLETRKCQVGH